MVWSAVVVPTLSSKMYTADDSSLWSTIPKDRKKVFEGSMLTLTVG